MYVSTYSMYMQTVMTSYLMQPRNVAVYAVLRVD